MKYYLISGEASGDLHAANLVKELKLLDAAAHFRCWGGDLLSAQGVELVKHYRDLAFMGFIEVAANIRTIFKNISFCKQDILQYKPDVLILIDYPGFNLRIAEFAKKNNIRVFYYISPQVWAWKQSRVHAIKAHVERMFVILPFEKDFYAKFNMKVDFVGHPLLDAVDGYRKNQVQNPQNKPVIALLPGSRKQEISRILPLMLRMADLFPDYHFVLAGAPSIPDAYYEQFTGTVNVEFIRNKTYSILSEAHAALVTSGTATLETALFEVPEVVCYQANHLSYLIARKLIKVKYISLVNLIMDREIVKELIQNDLNADNLYKELKLIIQDVQKRKQMKEDFVLLKKKLGGSGASAKTAALMYKYLNE